MKKIKKKQHIANPHLKYLLPIFIIALLVLVAVAYQNQQETNVLGKNTTNQTVLGEESDEEENEVEDEDEDENEDEVENEDEDENEDDEQEAEDIHDEIENEIEQGNVKKIELQPTSEKQDEGTLKVEQVNGATSEKNVPTSNTPVVQLQNSQSGTVAISVGKNGTITVTNNGVTVTTNYPVIMDPQTQTIAVRTENGVTIINTLPSQALNNVNQTDKPTVVESTTLEAQNGEAYYAVKGIQTRKFVGLVPVNANIETKVSTENGSVLSVDRPWYLDLLGFLYTI